MTITIIKTVYCPETGLLKFPVLIDSMGSEFNIICIGAELLNRKEHKKRMYFIIMLIFCKTKRYVE